MAEFLIYNTNHWMDALDSEQIAEYVKKCPKTFMDKYNARYQKDDVVEVQLGGYWIGPKAKAYDKSVFLLVIVQEPTFEDAKKYARPLYAQFPQSVLNPETYEFETEWVEKMVKKRRYSFSNVVDKQVFNNLSDIDIMDKNG